MIFYTATKEAATTTHKNTVEEQYRHAPLNGLIIGAIVGAVWALVVLGYLISLLLTEQDTELCPPELVMSPIFSCGWVAYRTVAANRRRLRRYNETKTQS